MIDFNFNALEGKWFIIYSNFPMWTSGKRTKASLNYKILNNKKAFCIADRVEFELKGRFRTINGFDKYLGNGKFLWRGRGFLSLLRSKWKIISYHENWALIEFESTLFTPAGYDLIARKKDLLEGYQERMNELKLDLQVIKQ